jgi:DNA-binding transcriptional regulator YdaS (Cro superfamily)
MEVRDLIETAIKQAGSEAKLGKATGYSQHAIWRAKKKGTVTPEMAVAIQRATNGSIPASQLRPDIFGSDDPIEPAPAKETERAQS